MLKSNWITETAIDFEYKKYELLAYLQKVDACFSRIKIFPHYPNLLEQQKTLQELKEKQNEFNDLMNKELIGIDWENKQLVYRKNKIDNSCFNEVNEIIEYALPKINKYADQGEEILLSITEKINISPVGLLPLYNKEGYMFLAWGKCAELFSYSTTIYEKSDDEHYNVNVKHLDSFNVNVSNTYENIKTQLIRNNPEMPNPATYLLVSEIKLPVFETFLPVAKKVLVKYIETKN
jgi:hypothetical protein